MIYYNLMSCLSFSSLATWMNRVFNNVLSNQLLQLFVWKKQLLFVNLGQLYF